MKFFACKTAVLLAALASFGATAQTAPGRCPSLPVDAGLQWETLEGPGFLFCRALRDADGSEAFAVTISGDSPFKPNRGDRAEFTSIAGQKDHWYRSEIAGDEDAMARETLLQLGSGDVAHISLRADDEAQLQNVMEQVSSIRFAADQRLSSN